MRLTKEEFVYALNKYKSMVETNTKVMNLLDVAPESDLFSAADEYYELLRKMCDFPDDTLDSALEHYCWELNFGEFARYTDPATPEELYDWIASETGVI